MIWALVALVAIILGFILDYDKKGPEINFIIGILFALCVGFAHLLLAA